MLDQIPDTIKNDEKNLYIKWKDGKECAYELLMLRKYCPCAECRGGHDANSVRTTDDITEIAVADTKKIGRYALSIVWSDQHEHGIYTFEDLRTACESGKPYGE